MTDLENISAIYQPKGLLFRFHRGSLDESMKTIKRFYDIESLAYHISQEFIDFEPTNTNLGKIEQHSSGHTLPFAGFLLKIKYYCFDERIGWDTYIVTAKFTAYSDDYIPVGFLNGNFNEAIEVQS